MRQKSREEPMYPFSYTGLKIIHDQEIQEALAHHCLDTGQATQRQGLIQMFKTLLARFNNHLAGNKQELLPDCAETSSKPF